MTQTDDASLWWNSRNNPVQEFEAPAPPPPPPSFISTEETDEPEPERLTNTELNTELNMIKLNEPTAEIIVSLTDTIIPLLLALFLKNSDSGAMKLSPDEHATLVSAWAAYLKTTNIALSPGTVLITTILTIYGAKIAVILMDRKGKSDELAEIKTQNKLLRETIIELKKKTDAAA